MRSGMFTYAKRTFPLSMNSSRSCAKVRSCHTLQKGHWKSEMSITHTEAVSLPRMRAASAAATRGSAAASPVAAGRAASAVAGSIDSPASAQARVAASSATAGNEEVWRRNRVANVEERTGGFMDIEGRTVGRTGRAHWRSYGEAIPSAGRVRFWNSPEMPDRPITVEENQLWGHNLYTPGPLGVMRLRPMLRRARNCGHAELRGQYWTRV